MGSKQSALIYIEKDNTTEAEFMSRSFVDRQVRNRAYINALGAELVMKFLTSEGLNVSNVHNIHSISKILEKYDIADVLLPNIHIDARVVFDEKQIFIPKSHFEPEITPDIYVVLKLDEHFEHVELLGFIEPKKINLKNANSDYYFVEKNRLTSADKLKQYIKNYTGSTSRSLSQEDMLRGRELSIMLADHNLSTEEEHELLELLLSSDELRESVLEFDNFETLAYNVAKTLVDKMSEPVIVPDIEAQEEVVNKEIDLSDTALQEDDIILDESFFADDENSENEETAQAAAAAEEEEEEEEEEETYDTTEDISSDEVVDEVAELPTEDVLQEEDVIEGLKLDEDMSDSLLDEPVIEETVEEETHCEEIQQDLPIETINEDIETGMLLEEPLLEENLTLDEPEPLKTETLDTPANEPEEFDINKGLAETISNAVQNSIEKSAQAASIAAGAAAIAATSEATVAGEAAIETTETVAAATEEAIKLAGVAGDLVKDVVEQNVEKQQKNLDRIDYAKTDIAPDVSEIPEHIAAMADLSTAKMEANLEAESSGQFENPHDLEELQPIENVHEELSFEQETIDLNAMDTVENDDIFEEDNGEVVNLGSITADSPTRPPENLHELNTENEFEGMDLPDMSSYTINEDGTSNMDNFGTDLNFNEEVTEHLVDFDNNINDITLDDDFGTDIGNIEEPIEETQSEEVVEQDNFEPVSEPIEETHEEISMDEFLGDDTVSVEDISLDEFNTEEVQLDENTDLEPEPVEDEIVSDDEITQEDTPIENIEPETAQDWIEDTNYDNLEDVELPAPEPVQEEIPTEEMIVEPDIDNQKVFDVIENSTVISDKNFTVGEIPIDINNAQAPIYQESESLESIYNEDKNIAGGALLQSPGRLGTNRSTGGSGLGIVFKLIGGLVVLAIVCVIGFNAAKLFKAPTEEAPQPITDDAVPTAPEATVTDNNSLDVNPDNVVSMDNATNSLVNPTTMKKPQPIQTAQSPVTTPKKQTGSGTFLEVKKLTWEVPDYISYNPQFKQYFQAVGKSLKLALTSDLLLATDYAYSNEVRVSVTFAKDGTFKGSQILKSSGSTQIDNIVLQTVNQTLKALKAPQSVGNDESTTAILKIYL